MAPWQCQQCNAHCKASAEYCAMCGSHWSYKPYAGQWQRAPNRPKSPGRYTQSPRPRRRGRGKGDQAKGKDEQAKGGKGLQQEPATIATSSKAPTLEGLPQPPKAAAVSAPKNALAQAASSTTPAEKQLDALVKALRSSKGQIPQEAQQMLDQLQQTQTQQEAKSMHRAVSQQSTAKKEIEKIKTARALYLQHWSQYIQGLADLLQQQMEEQEAVLTTFDDKEAQWQEALGKASTELQQLTKHGAPQEISDTEADMEAAEEQVDRAIAEEQQEEQRREALKQQNQQVKVTLEHLRNRLRPGRTKPRAKDPEHHDASLHKQQNLAQRPRTKRRKPKPPQSLARPADELLRTQRADPPASRGSWFYDGL